MKYALTQETLNDVLTYLGNRPYFEVALLIDSIKNAQPVNIVEKKVTTEKKEESKNAN